MRSQYADHFNHDEEAEGYDQEVSNELDPIRAGYQQLLHWVIQTAQIMPTSRVLDLGTGTGNLAQLIPDCQALDCVDISAKMLDLARPKLGHLASVRFMQADLLEAFDLGLGTYDAVISTYAIHHLTEPEKFLLFERIWDYLHPGGRAVFGDLMLTTAAQAETKAQAYREAGHPEVAEGILEEFFWSIETTQERLEGLGFRVQVQPCSDLSWGILAQRS